MRCPSCRSQVDDDSAFCARCGRPLSESASASPFLRGYQLLEPLAEDERAGTFRARHVEVGAERLVRVLHGASGREEELRRRAASLAALRNEALLPLVDFGVGEDGHVHVVFDVPEGRPLDEVLGRWGALPPREAARLLAPLAGALEALTAAGLSAAGLEAGDVFVLRRGRAWRVQLLPVATTAVSESGPVEPAGRSALRFLSRIACRALAGRVGAADDAELLAGLGDVDVPASLRQALGDALEPGRGGPRTPGDVVALFGTDASPPAAPAPAATPWGWLVAAALAVVLLLAALHVAYRSGGGARQPTPADAAAARAARLVDRGEPAAALDLVAPGGTPPAGGAALEVAARAWGALARAGDDAARERALLARHELLRQRPADVASLSALGELHALSGDLDRAGAWWDAALVTASVPGVGAESHAALLNDVAVVAAADGDLDRAGALLGQLLVARAGDARALANRGVLRVADGRLGDAEADLREALRIEPELVGARTALAETLRRFGRVDEAREEVRAALAAAPADAAALNLAGVLAEDRGDLAEAVRLYAAAAAAAPESAVVGANLARLRGMGAR